MTLYTLRIYKNFAGLGTNGEFSNTYHFMSDDDITSVNVLGIANAFYGAESKIFTPSVIFDRMTVSTYAQEGRKGHPEAFKEIGLNAAAGQAAAPGAEGHGHDLPSTECLAIKHSCANGRSGRNLYRGAVPSGLWAYNNGEPVLTGDLGYTLFPFQHDILSQTVSPWVVPNSADPSGLPARNVTAVTLGGIVAKQRRNRRKKKHETQSSIGGIVKQAVEGGILIAAAKAGWALLKNKIAAADLPAAVTTLEEELAAAGLTAEEIAPFAAAAL